MENDFTYRPFTKHEKRMHKLAHEPWMYEYHVDPAPLPEMVFHNREKKEGGLGLFLLALLFSIMDLPDPKELSIEGLEKYERPRADTAK